MRGPKGRALCLHRPGPASSLQPVFWGANCVIQRNSWHVHDWYICRYLIKLEWEVSKTWCERFLPRAPRLEEWFFLLETQKSSKAGSNQFERHIMLTNFCTAPAIWDNGTVQNYDNKRAKRVTWQWHDASENNVAAAKFVFHLHSNLFVLMMENPLPWTQA